MLRGPLYDDGYRPQFSGHETFPLRYGWLKKAFDAVERTKGKEDNRSVFTGPEAIAHFGVGKNMVASMRHWATVTGIVEDVSGKNKIEATSLGRRIFADDGFDPYMENPATSWLLHWHLCGRNTKTTWYWVFHYCPTNYFDRESLVEGIGKLAGDRDWSRASAATIRRDVSCFLRTYVALHPLGQNSYEDGLESPLTELGLIKPTGRRDGFRFARGPKTSLGVGVFCYAVADYWNRTQGSANTMSFEALTHRPGSPGRAFLLDENDMVDMLVRLSETIGVYRWSETAGLRQLIKNGDFTADDAMEWLERDYSGSLSQELHYAFG